MKDLALAVFTAAGCVLAGVFSPWVGADLSPFAAAVLPQFTGSLFFIAIGGRLLLKRPQAAPWFWASALGLALAAKVSGVITLFTIVNLVAGLMPAALIHLWGLGRSNSHLRALMAFITISLLYGVIRSKLMPQMYYNALTVNMADTTLPLPLRQALASLTRVFVHLDFALWAAPASAGAWLGSLMLARSKVAYWQANTMRLPFALVYVLIPALAAVANPWWPHWAWVGRGVVLVLSVPLLAQGAAVLSWWWGAWFNRARLLGFVLVVALALNPFVVLLIMLTGMFDIWFDFRKLDQEE